jgi:hypothetical protein
MAVETVESFCPHRIFGKLIGLGSKYLSLESNLSTWYYPTGPQVTDPGYLAEILSSPEDLAVVLKHVGHDGSGSPSKARFKAEWSGMSVSKVSEIVEWMKLPVGQRKLSAMGGLIEIVNPGGLDAEIDEGYVRIRGGADGSATKIYPDTEVDTFTYWIGNRQPLRPAWEEAVRSRLAVIDQSLAWE